ncbi:TadE/TadG family type IV pilus assembly protein [Paraliobacillus sediminis]|uniref:TadE/TadG family type IV pilus assembly protein n=1 Tax=Paraliobacillus sediminis TaxID=1885916 RepID=UPI0013C2E595|nr:TadE/TadG family type IV pilus assembly protein [Paraliobacillus sediminis]
MKLLRRKEDGSITLEAAVFMPFFILFLVFLLYMIKFALTDIALNRATSETAKQIATQVYPLQVTRDAVENVVTDKYEEITADLGDNKALIENELTASLTADLIGKLEEGANGMAADALTILVQSYLVEADQMNIVEKDNVKVKTVVLPVISGATTVEIVTRYEIDLPIPFIERTFILEKKAVEKAWLGNGVED